MRNTITELQDIATNLLASELDNKEARKEWSENVRNLLQQLSIYHLELEHQNAALAASEQDLIESREKYIELFEDAPVGYVIIEQHGIITHVNRTFTEMCVSPYLNNAVVVGRLFSDFIYPNHKEIFDRFLEKLSNSIHIISIEMKLIDYQGKARFVTITAGKRKPSSREFRLTINDITSRKKLEIKLLSAQKEADENNAKKRLFLTHINNELRTPLTSITGLCEMLEAPELIPDTRRNYLATLKNVAFAMKIVSDEIMDISLVDSGVVKFQKEAINVAKICRDHAQIAQNAVAGKEITISCEVEHIPFLLGDSDRIETVVHSIFRHAIANVTKGDICLCGEYEPSPDDSGMLKLKLFGNGVGIEDTNSNEVYSCDCSGIELFLARQILKFMGGWLSCEASGNLIRVEIPLSRAPQAPSLPVYEEKQILDKSLRCMIVDDVDLNLQVHAALIRKLGCEPIMCSSGKEALKTLARTQVDIILTDLWMPEMNGMEFAMSVRQMPDYNKIPLIAITADVDRSENFDMNYFSGTLIKPVKLKTLNDILFSSRSNSLNK